MGICKKQQSFYISGYTQYNIIFLDNNKNKLCLKIYLCGANITVTYPYTDVPWITVNYNIIIFKFRLLTLHKQCILLNQKLLKHFNIGYHYYVKFQNY